MEFMIMFLEDVACLDEGLLNIMRLVRLIIRVIQIAVPIGLILFGTIDMAKAVIAGDEKKMKEAQKPFVKRIISAIIVFLIPFIVNLVINFVVSGASDWSTCWDEAGTGTFQKIDGSGTLSTSTTKPNTHKKNNGK